MLLLWKFFVIGFSALLPLVNPLGSALVFLGLVGFVPTQVYRSLARRIAINTIIFFAVIELIGSTLLGFFGISLPIVQVSGGVVLAAMGWSLLNEKNSAPAPEKMRTESIESPVEIADLKEKAFYPLTFPITAGPGTIVVMLTLSVHASRGGTLATKVLSHVGLFSSAIALSVLVYLCYANAPRITRAISPSTAHGILRVIAFILLCIGVQIAWNGLSELLKTVLVRG
jgi:multiple antibiotic resistance protein